MLDFEYAKALAEVVLDTTCSEKEREVRLECSTQIFGRANAYLKKGFFHSMKKLAGIYQNTKEPIFRELPFFIFTDNKDLSLEYQYRHEGVSDYITSPVNIPELIRRICYFVEE